MVSRRDAQGDFLSLGDGVGLAVAERLESPCTGGGPIVGRASLECAVHVIPPIAAEIAGSVEGNVNPRFLTFSLISFSLSSGLSRSSQSVVGAAVVPADSGPFGAVLTGHRPELSCWTYWTADRVRPGGRWATPSGRG